MDGRFVNVDRDTPMLLPVDLRDWVPEDDLVHFVIQAVDTMRLPTLKVNPRRSGSEQYPPTMMLALVIYCYANGVFSSRRIERATYRDLSVRYLTADTHPDHDTICTFRRENGAAVEQAFVEILRLACEMGVLKVGTISVDGTHIKANASIHRSVRYDRAGELEQQLISDVKDLMRKAEEADGQEDPSAQELPKEIARREKLREKLQEARRMLEKRAAEEKQQKACDKGNDKDDNGGNESGSTKPKDSAQTNLTDADSAIMRKSRHAGYEQAYNAQATVDADGSQLILAVDVDRTPSDANHLEPAVEATERNVGKASGVLADAGYINSEAMQRLEAKQCELYVPIGREDQNHRSYDFRPPKTRTKRTIKDPYLLSMEEKLATPEAREIYKKRRMTVEPVFGTIKGSLQFRQFLLRGIGKVKIEWGLVCLAYNMKRLWKLQQA